MTHLAPKTNASTSSETTASINSWMFSLANSASASPGACTSKLIRRKKVYGDPYCITIKTECFNKCFKALRQPVRLILDPGPSFFGWSIRTIKYKDWNYRQSKEATEAKKKNPKNGILPHLGPRTLRMVDCGLGLVHPDAETRTWE